MKWNSSMNSEMKVWAHHLYLLDSSQHILRNDKLCFWILLVGFQNFIWHYTADRWCTKELEIQFKFNVVCHWNKEKQNKTKNKRVLVVLSLRPLHILLFIICNNYSFKEPFSVYLHCTCCDILCCFILKTATRTSILLPTYDCMITLWTYVFQDAHSDRKCRMSGDKKKTNCFVYKNGLNHLQLHAGELKKKTHIFNEIQMNSLEIMKCASPFQDFHSKCLFFFSIEIVFFFLSWVEFFCSFFVKKFFIWTFSSFSWNRV